MRARWLWIVVVLAAGSCLYWCNDDDPPAPESTEVSAGADSLDGAADDDDAAVEPESDPPFNPAWIGAACEVDADCPFEGGRCLTPEEGYPGGHCTQFCTTSCPDRRGDYFSDTLCVDDPRRAGEGICMARCALHLSPSGCRTGYVCATTARHSAPSTERLACVPDLGTPPPETECTEALRAFGLSFGRPDMSDGETLLGESRKSCQIDTPVLLANPIHHVDYRETGRRLAEHLLVACAMAVAVDRMSQVFAALEIVEVEHVGTYNCRGIAGSTRLSAHAEGRALDIKGFERANGSPVSVLRDWNGPNRERRAFLRKVVKQLKKEKIFRIILTPDSDVRHADHLHVEIRR